MLSRVPVLNSKVPLLRSTVQQRLQNQIASEPHSPFFRNKLSAFTLDRFDGSLGDSPANFSRVFCSRRDLPCDALVVSPAYRRCAEDIAVCINRDGSIR